MPDLATQMKLTGLDLSTIEVEETATKHVMRVYVMGARGGPKHAFDATRHDLRLFAEAILHAQSAP